MSCFRFSTAIAVALFVIPTQSSAFEAVRCNTEVSPGLYKPILRMISQAGITDVRLGEHGLTRAAYYRDEKLKDYIASKFGVARKDIQGRISNGCGTAQDDTVFAGAVDNGSETAATEPEPEEEEYDEGLRLE